MMGFRSRRILFREVLPNVMAFDAVVRHRGRAVAIVGRRRPLLPRAVGTATSTDLGQHDRGGLDVTSRRTPGWPCAPPAVLCLTVLALNFAGDGLRSFFDVKDSAL